MFKFSEEINICLEAIDSIDILLLRQFIKQCIVDVILFPADLTLSHPEVCLKSKKTSEILIASKWHCCFGFPHGSD